MAKYALVLATILAFQQSSVTLAAPTWSNNHDYSMAPAPYESTSAAAYASTAYYGNGNGDEDDWQREYERTMAAMDVAPETLRSTDLGAGYDGKRRASNSFGFPKAARRVQDQDADMDMLMQPFQHPTFEHMDADQSYYAEPSLPQWMGDANNHHGNLAATDDDTSSSSTMAMTGLRGLRDYTSDDYDSPRYSGNSKLREFGGTRHIPSLDPDRYLPNQFVPVDGSTDSRKPIPFGSPLPVAPMGLDETREEQHGQLNEVPLDWFEPVQAAPPIPPPPRRLHRKRPTEDDEEYNPGPAHPNYLNRPVNLDQVIHEWEHGRNGHAPLREGRGTYAMSTYELRKKVMDEYYRLGDMEFRKRYAKLLDTPKKLGEKVRRDRMEERKRERLAQL